MFNARWETVAQKPSFRSAYKRRRCLVPANGYYEWQKHPDGKQPYFIHAADGTPVAFAGLYEFWPDQGDDALVTFSILTAQAMGDMARIHDRVPVMLGADARDAWLDVESDPDELQVVIASTPPPMDVTRVGGDVGNVRNNHAGLIEPAS